MNNWQVTLTIDSLNSTYNEEGKITLHGTGKFQYYDNKEWMECPIAFQAWGNAALTIDNVGIDGMVMVSGKFNLFKNSDELNPKMMLKVERAIAIKGDFEDMSDLGLISEPTLISEPITTVEPQRELVAVNANNNGHQKPAPDDDKDLDSIPF
ncbi:hypothetical protein [Gloeothece verrucosa]|uniref:Uncharacterized protein n=1 Tax=Gloeothece verrucosa (strain PCC 7822) TaxID=497965 RepID=E0UNQ1_GLOV7|nr:hypothetical protein [Gloeothece verrucosa]ADN18581.1 hypothetical protein Cyan7822_6943 [Gloeothece verrucosa PCC 7822]